MPKRRSWTDEQLIEAVKASYSYRNVIKLLGLVPAGGNYLQVHRAVSELKLDTAHFTGSGWNKGRRYHLKSAIPVEKLLTKNSYTQSYKLKLKLIERGLKTPRCKFCGWAEVSPDGRIPVELDHINGNHLDNRLENLRILCPNCHSLQVTHRGKNKGKLYR